MTPAYCWVQVARLRSWADVGQMERHGLRRGNPEEFSNCDPARRHLNQFGSDLPGADPTAVGANLKRMTQEASARRRKDAAVAAHLMLLASPAFFRPNDVAGIGNEDPKRVEAFRDAARKAVRERFGPIPAWRMDLDEATPAIDVFLVPLTLRRRGSGEDQYWVSYRDVFGGPKGKLRLLQGWFGEAMAPLGLIRGNPVEETGAERIPLHEQYRLLARDRAIAEAARLEREHILQQAQEDAALARADRSRAAIENHQAEKVYAAAAEAHRGAEQREQEAEKARQTAQSEATEAAKQEAAARAMVAQARVSQVEAEKAKSAADALLRKARSEQASAAEALRSALGRECAAEDVFQTAASSAAAAAGRDKDARAAQAQAQVVLADAERLKDAAARVASEAREQLRNAEKSQRFASAEQAAAEVDRREAAIARGKAEEAREGAVADRNSAAAKLQEAQDLKDYAAADRRNAAAMLVTARADQSAAFKLAKALSMEFDHARKTALEEATSVINPLVEFRTALQREMEGILVQRRGWPSEVRAATDPVLMALLAISKTRMNEVLDPFSPAAGEESSAEALIKSVDVVVSERLTSLMPTFAATLRPGLTPLSEAALAPQHRPPRLRNLRSQHGISTPAAQTNLTKTGLA